MSLIFTEDGWKQLVPPTVNEVWELTTWDEIKRENIPDKGPGSRLTFMGTRPGLPSMAVEGGFYQGHVPSERACEYINSLKEKMKFFDDGLRMVYGRPDRRVEVEKIAVAHPIKYPPAGFVMRDDTWVLKPSAYD